MGTHRTQGAGREFRGAAAAGGMEVRLEQDQGWTFLQLPFSEGVGPAAKKGAVCLECGSSSKFGSWALDEEECGGQLARQWGHPQPEGMARWSRLELSALWHLNTPSVQNERRAAFSWPPPTHSRVLIGLLEDQTCCLGLISAVKCLVEPDTHTHSHSDTHPGKHAHLH